MSISRRMRLLSAAVLFVPLSGRAAQEPQPAPPLTAPETGTKAASSSAAKQGYKNGSHANDFLVHGTVFAPSGLSLPGAVLKIHREGEKKFRWETRTNTRGEFAMRVLQGAKYEVVVQAKGFKEQSRAVDGKTGARDESFVFRMERQPGGKS